MDRNERNSQLRQEVADGIEAKSLAQHPVFKEAVQTLEASYIKAIRSGSWFKKRAREENCRRLQVLDDLVAILEHKINRGEEALKRLEANNGHK